MAKTPSLSFFSFSQCILITYTDTCLRPFESVMPNLERETRVLLGESGLHPFVTQPHLPSFTSHLSFGHVQYRGQLWPLNSWECLLAALTAVKETHPSLSQFTPVLPVALLLWCCAPAPLVSAVGSCPGSNSLTTAKSKPVFLLSDQS